MMIFFISCLSFILVFNSISCMPLLPRLSKWMVISSDCMKRMSCFSVFQVPRIFVGLITNPSCNPLVESVENKGDDDEMTLLDLHGLPLDSILERLSPTELCSMAGVCSYLRNTCRSDYFWKRHMEQKWGKVIRDRDWQCHGASGDKASEPNGCKGFFGYLSSFWPFSLVTSKLKGRNKNGDPLPCNDSIMEQYLSLENGKLWFVAQVYNRENGHGFLLSCYDAELSYNSTSDTFKARYSPRGRHTIEENISWDRLRSPPVNTPPYALHESDCLQDLKPGDHFEIQWRRNKDYPYGWWYGVVGHLDSCIRNENWCQCHTSDTVMLEFNQYSVDSRWRRTTVNRTNHREQGNDGDGFYGGIRKLNDPKEISTWRNIWPKNILD